jgi:hypothetical protein
MNEHVHVALSGLLRTVLSRCAAENASTIFGVYHQAPAYLALPMPELAGAFGMQAEGSTEHLGALLEDLARSVAAGEVREQRNGLAGVGLILEVDFEMEPIHLLTVVCHDQAVHRVGVSREGGEPRAAIFLSGGLDMSADPLVRGLTAILLTLTGGEQA